MIKQGIVWVLAFSLAFVLSSPSSVFTVRSSFVRGLLYESLHNSFGHNFEATTDRLGWLRILSSTDVLNPLVLSLAILGLALAVCRIARHGRDELLSPETIISTWSVLYLAFLISSAKVLTLRALLPVVPSLLVLAIATLCRVLSFAARRLPRIPATALTPAVLAAFIGLQLVLSGPRLLQYRQSSITREEDSEAVAIGEWLATRYAHEARVLYDPYTYVPPVFRDAHVTPWGGTLDMLAALQPDIVLVNELTSEQFSDPLRAGTYARDEELFMAKLDYYESLKKGTGGYELVRNSGAIRVYVRH